MPEMVVIPSGSFQMGCVSGKDCLPWEKPVHEVKIDSFALSKYEVTFEEFDAFLRATQHRKFLTDDSGWGRGRRPVVQVTWYDASAYAAWLSSQTDKRYRLPTEAEWEYAARAGTETMYSWGNDIDVNRANCDGCAGQWDNAKTAPVGSFEANSWGLHDMHGNVMEWVQDCWNESYEGAPTDGSAWRSGNCSERVVRGGAWLSYPRYLRSSYRSRISIDYRYSNNIGFRVARSF